MSATWILEACEMGGDLSIDFDDRLTVDGSECPVITWRMTPYAADGVRRALAALGTIGALMEAGGGDGPNGWECAGAALGEALTRLLDAGLVKTIYDEHLDFVFHEPTTGA